MIGSPASLPGAGDPVMMDLTPVTLDGRHVRLEPLSPAHAASLASVALDAELWRWTPTQIHSAGDLDAYIETARAAQAAGTALPFAIVERATGRAIGSTRFGNIDAGNCRVEVGWSWLGRAFQRKAFNTEAKLLLLTHAFERMGCIRVELRADALNTKSRNAIVRLGAREEGILRHHMILPDGRLIDWVYYSILRDEWPSVRAGLEGKLASHARG
ncbi:MAG: GNAT family protein [Gemmatimonadaceae bacterium]